MSWGEAQHKNHGYARRAGKEPLGAIMGAPGLVSHGAPPLQLWAPLGKELGRAPSCAVVPALTFCRPGAKAWCRCRCSSASRQQSVRDAPDQEITGISSPMHILERTRFHDRQGVRLAASHLPDYLSPCPTELQAVMAASFLRPLLSLRGPNWVRTLPYFR